MAASRAQIISSRVTRPSRRAPSLAPGIRSKSQYLAAVLIGMGLVAVCARRVMPRLPSEGPLIHRWLPLTSAAMITVLGCVIAIRGLVAAGVLPIRI